MQRLKTEPVEVVTDLGDVRRVAAALATAAARLYRRLADGAAELGRAEAARVFAELESHYSAPGSAGGHSDAGADLRTPVLEEEGLGDDRNLGAYEAWALAVRNSERTFAYWSYLSAHVGDPAVAGEAERLAEKADALAGRFRAERRRAYHATRREEYRRLPVASLAAFAGAAAREEAALSALHRAIAGELARLSQPDAESLARLADAEAELARDLVPVVDLPQPDQALPSEADDLRRLARARLERVLDLYLIAGETARDEQVLALTQGLSESKLSDIAGLG
jgi:hypothetical protein